MSESLAYFEWSVDAPNPDDVSKALRESAEAVAVANPALGIRISSEHVANERASMDPRTFNVERLGVGDWPALDEDGAVIPVAKWLELVDPDSRPLDPVCFAFDVPPNRASASIGVASRRADGLLHVEVIEQHAGTGWVAARLAELVRDHRPLGVVYDSGAAGASLQPEIQDAGVSTTPITAREHAQACGLFYDAVEQQTLRHLGTRELVDALRVAVKRPLGDAWAWDRRTSSVDISPLVASTLALYGALTLATEPFVLSF